MDDDFGRSLALMRIDPDFKYALAWLLGNEKNPPGDLPSIGQEALVRILKDESRQIPMDLRRALARAIEPVSVSKMEAKLVFSKRGAGRPKKEMQAATATSTQTTPDGKDRPAVRKEQIAGEMQTSGLSYRSVERARAAR